MKRWKLFSNNVNSRKQLLNAIKLKIRSKGAFNFFVFYENDRCTLDKQLHRIANTIFVIVIVWKQIAKCYPVRDY